MHGHSWGEETTDGPSDKVSGGHAARAQPDPHACCVGCEAQSAQDVVEEDGDFHAVSPSAPAAFDYFLECMLGVDGDGVRGRVVQGEILVWNG